jgi:hypothetical protein
MWQAANYRHSLYREQYSVVYATIFSLAANR